MIVKNCLRKLRKERRLTLSTLAHMTQIGESTLSEFERGVHLPRIDAALMIARALGVDVGAVFWIEKEGTKDGHQG